MNTTRTTRIKPTASQRRILLALARPGAKAINGPYGLFITNGRGWTASDITLTEPTLSHLICVGWVLHQATWFGRCEYALTALGREATAMS